MNNSPPSPTSNRPVVVVGAGISGVACARVLHDAGVAVRLVDRGRRIGGRMAVRTERGRAGDAGRPVDIGASYFTVRDERFAAVAQDWRDRGLAAPWTDTFHLLTPDGLADPTNGPERWASPGGLRSLVEDLASGLDVTQPHEVEEVDVAAGALTVDGEPAAAVVLAMPEPQAYDLLPEPVAKDLGLDAGLDWTPSISVWARWPQRWWPDLDGAFVDGSPVISWIADDGRRRGDGAPVLVVHTTAAFAAARLDDPGSAAQPVLDELAALLGATDRAAARATAGAREPEFLRVHRWALAAPQHPHEQPFALHPALVGVCGDAWGPRPRVEQAWLSGHLLGEELTRRLGG